MSRGKLSRTAAPLLSGLVAVLTGCSSSEHSESPPNETAGVPIMVGPTVMVSADDPGREHSEYMADADPNNPKNVMVCVMRFVPEENRLTSALYNTFDGGKSWNIGMIDEDPRARFGGVWDPACEYGPDSSAYFVTLANLDVFPTTDTPFHTYEHWQMGGDERMRIFRSGDGGKTWGDPVTASFIDREDLKIDRTGGQYDGRMYIFGVGATWLVYSEDGGTTWMKSAEMEAPGEGRANMALGEVLPDGTLLFLGSILPEAKGGKQLQHFAVARSTDGGATTSEFDAIAGFNGPAGNAGPAQRQPVAMAVDHSGGRYRGRVYALWKDKYRGRYAHFVSYSDDKGKNWSVPVWATDPPPINTGGRDRYYENTMPQIIVNKDGVVGVTWYDWAEGNEETNAYLRFSASLDGGESWLPSVQVSELSLTVKGLPEMAVSAKVSGGGVRNRRERTDTIDVRAWPSPRAYYPWNNAPGDYTGIAAAADGAFHTFWVGTKEGRAEMYTARVMVTGEVTAPDHGQLVGLDNLTRLIEFQVTSSVWNPDDSTYTIEYRLLNTSDTTLDAPLKVRLAQIKSHLGNPTVIHDDGTRSWSGTILDLSDRVEAQGLEPKETTLSQALRFEFEEVNGLFDFTERDVLHLRVEVYGKRKSRFE